MFRLLSSVYTIFKNYIYPPTTRKNIPKNIRLLTWKTYNNNNTIGKCYACDGHIDNRNWHCSHVVSDKKGGLPIVENLRPCCQHCNLSCGKQNLYAYIKDKKLTGLGQKHVTAYMKKNPSQFNSKRV